MYFNTDSLKLRVRRPLVDCKGLSEGYVLMVMCTGPCMQDAFSKCCIVLPEFA